MPQRALIITIHVAQDAIRWWALVNTVMDHLVLSYWFGGCLDQLSKNVSAPWSRFNELDRHVIPKSNQCIRIYSYSHNSICYNQENSALSLCGGVPPKFIRRPGSVGPHGELYGIWMASFLFAPGLNNTEKFQLISKVNGAARDFDDVVFKNKLKEQDICKKCFIQLKHKKNKYTIHRSSLKQLSGDFSLFKYFESDCQFKVKICRQ
jgi:hypothetical protein